MFANVFTLGSMSTAVTMAFGKVAKLLIKRKYIKQPLNIPHSQKSYPETGES